uniref:Antirestriction protein KlcA n=1 Tax=Escherichia coli TaxID=562 RepID=A0A6G6AID8_ECOLX|nr:Antirestriction protein KlcA [Escherichia coli]
MQYAKPVTLNVEECDRLSFLPYLFGNDFLYAEAYVYALAQKMMPEYQGGFWHFIRLPDGGGYMMPDGDRFHMVNGANWFDRTVSADAAGTRQSPPNPLARFRAAATVRCVKTRLAATVPVAPPLSRRDLRSLHT